MCVSGRTNDIAKSASLSSWLDGGDDGEYNVVGIVEISHKVAIQDAFFFSMKSLV